MPYILCLLFKWRKRKERNSSALMSTCWKRMRKRKALRKIKRLIKLQGKVRKMGTFCLTMPSGKRMRWQSKRLLKGEQPSRNGRSQYTLEFSLQGKGISKPGIRLTEQFLISIDQDSSVCICHSVLPPSSDLYCEISVMRQICFLYRSWKWEKVAFPPLQVETAVHDWGSTNDTHLNLCLLFRGSNAYCVHYTLFTC